MTRGKRAKLQHKTARSRATPREGVVITGTCEIGERPKGECLVTDLGLSGCRMRADAVGVTRSETLLLWFGEYGPVPGMLKWTKGGELGVLFDVPLAEDTLEALLETSEPPRDNVVPLKRSAQA